MLDLMNKLTALSITEAKSTDNAFDWKKKPEKEKSASLIHKGTYGNEYQGDDEDDDKKKKKAPADGEKRGRGRPAKGSDASGNVVKHHTKELQDVIVGNKPSKAVDKLPKTKHNKTLKDWIENLDKALNEDGQLTLKPMAGAQQIIGPDGKPVGTASTPAAALAVKNGEVTLGNNEEGVAEGSLNRGNMK